jgi:hypothetical protein
LGKGQVVGACECANEPSGCIKCEGFFLLAGVLIASEDLCRIDELRHKSLRIICKDRINMLICIKINNTLRLCKAYMSYEYHTHDI